MVRAVSSQGHIQFNHNKSHQSSSQHFKNVYKIQMTDIICNIYIVGEVSDGLGEIVQSVDPITHRLTSTPLRPPPCPRTPPPPVQRSAPDFPRTGPPTLVPPTKMCGSNNCLVISSSAALFYGASMKPRIHSWPREISWRLVLALSSSAMVCVQDGEYSYVSGSVSGRGDKTPIV